ncbi:hypothetical protein DBR06_SOUSAS4310060 [Sousa chinensis]|uniref:Uncharacterized protein n=1 Tax=Sousa chinensis TaxID=103600 RepID=A0A484GGX1_SOUCH|nr:hypothetical protein DBR06_SOUSAS4310060 [Sousa chinensis]
MLHWMVKVGNYVALQSLYFLSQKALEVKGDWSLEDIGI